MIFQILLVEKGIVWELKEKNLKDLSHLDLGTMIVFIKLLEVGKFTVFLNVIGLNPQRLILLGPVNTMEEQLDNTTLKNLCLEGVQGRISLESMKVVRGLGNTAIKVY
mmetsp:Transcript_23928/g.3998  ORF Transcript_23928/g.3998 Transcript_23928/m.3998 type:complete len:108 (+) Transcript_23928:690-1013(+)